MSSIAVNAITDANAGNTATINSVTPNVNNVLGKNRIINGNMMIDQRNAGASVTPTTDQTYTIDRWMTRIGVGRFSIVQSSTSAVNFPTSALLTVTTTSAPSSTEIYGLEYRVEGYNIADLNFGTANAQSITISFQVRSSLIGTYCVSLRNSGATRSYVAEFTINTANTFETKTVTIPGDTSGTWLTTNGQGFLFNVCLGTGSTRKGTAGSWQGSNIVATTNQVDWINTSGATFYITGVQLEAGSSATEFEHRPYGTELALCQRYYQQITYAGSTIYYLIGTAYNATNIYSMNVYSLPVTMRSAPTFSTTGTFVLADGLGANPPASTLTFSSMSMPNSFTAQVVSSGLTTARTYYLLSTTSSALKISAEL
jgi:hypothetical protein